MHFDGAVGKDAVVNGSAVHQPQRAAGEGVGGVVDWRTVRVLEHRAVVKFQHALRVLRGSGNAARQNDLRAAHADADILRGAADDGAYRQSAVGDDLHAAADYIVTVFTAVFEDGSAGCAAVFDNLRAAFVAIHVAGGASGDGGVDCCAAAVDVLRAAAVDGGVFRRAAVVDVLPAAAVDGGMIRLAAVVDVLLAAAVDGDIRRRASDVLHAYQCAAGGDASHFDGLRAI